MALIHVHKIMIGTALGFSVLFSLRGFAIGEPVLGSIFSVASVGLAVYAAWFWTRKAAVLSDAARADDSE